MDLINSRIIRSIIGLFVIFSTLSSTAFSQKKSLSGLNLVSSKNIIRQDTSLELRNRKGLSTAEPDTNFTYEKYAAFLKKVSDTSKYIVLPINQFRKTINSNKIVIGLRHDVDIDLNKALQFSATESELGFRSTYYILHTAPYYLDSYGNMSVHSETILPVLKEMQNVKHFEIGWHNDLVTLQAVYNIDPVAFLHNELAWLRGNGIHIYGSASHGSPYCHDYKYLNFYFFEECTYPVVDPYYNNLNLSVGGKIVPMKKGKFIDFNLEYEAYFLNNNKYFSDAKITNGVRWNIGMLDISNLQAGDRVIILLHPVHWHKGSVNANIESFTIPGQIRSIIDPLNSIISVEMPVGTNRNSLNALFSLSPGAFAKVSGKLQVNGKTLNNFSDPLIYTVYAENREIYKEWTITVLNKPLPVENKVSAVKSIVIYPNPSDGNIKMKFLNMQSAPLIIDIFNTKGEKVYTSMISKKGEFIVEADLSYLPSGVYFVKRSDSDNPVKIVIRKR